MSVTHRHGLYCDLFGCNNVVDDNQELHRLREWKTSALALLGKYQAIADTFPSSLGQDRVDILRDGIQKLRLNELDKVMKYHRSEFAVRVTDELNRARAHHEPIHSLHEGYAVIAEELDELWDLVRLKTSERNLADVLKELVQTAAMCQRTAEDLGLLAASPR